MTSRIKHRQRSASGKFHDFANKSGERECRMNVRSLIMEADRIARQKGMSQVMWSSLAGTASNGQTVSRIIAKGDCKMTTFAALLDALGYEMAIIRKEDL